MHISKFSAASFLLLAHILLEWLWLWLQHMCVPYAMIVQSVCVRNNTLGVCGRVNNNNTPMVLWWWYMDAAAVVSDDSAALCAAVV